MAKAKHSTERTAPLPPGVVSLADFRADAPAREPLTFAPDHVAPVITHPYLQAMRDWTRPPRQALPPSAFLALAVFDALQAQAAKGGGKHSRAAGRVPILRALDRLRERFADDRDVRVALAGAVDMVFSDRDGRW